MDSPPSGTYYKPYTMPMETTRQHDWRDARITELEDDAKRLREAGNALIDFHNGPLEAKRPDIWHRILTRFVKAMEQS
jgi:hypothetical protein